MVELPHGTVTFLLTDIVGSSALWEASAETMRAALARHDALFDQVVNEHRGHHVRPRGEGDSRFAVFPSTVDAVNAAAEFQRLLAAELWPTPRPITVRIGIHIGHGEWQDGDYYGQAVNRCAGIRNLGRGGETMLSEAAVAVARDDLPRTFVLRDLGKKPLKNMARPDRPHLLLDASDLSLSHVGVMVDASRFPPHLLAPSWRRLLPLVMAACIVALGLALSVAWWMVPAERVLLADDFDALSPRALPEASDFPNEFAVGYSGTEYEIQSIALSQDRLPSVVVPGWYGDATLAIDARLVGVPDPQAVVIGCRNVGPRTGYRLTLRPGQGTGSLDRDDDTPVPIRLAPISNSTAIRRQTAVNHIELRCVGTWITATVNATIVATIQDTTYPAGRMWIGASVDRDSRAFGIVMFDNLVVHGHPTITNSIGLAGPTPSLPANQPSDPN